jgi:hypothetical protein
MVLTKCRIAKMKIGSRYVRFVASGGNNGSSDAPWHSMRDSEEFCEVDRK